LLATLNDFDELCFDVLPNDVEEKDLDEEVDEDCENAIFCGEVTVDEGLLPEDSGLLPLVVPVIPPGCWPFAGPGVLASTPTSFLATVPTAHEAHPSTSEAEPPAELDVPDADDCPGAAATPACRGGSCFSGWNIVEEKCD
jgi:hypothetical protein